MNRTATAVLIAALALGLSACGSDKDDDKPAAKTPPAPSKSVVIPKASASKQIAEAEAKLGIPPRPDAAAQAKYIAALTAIDVDIVHGKPDKAVDRGRNQCTTIAGNPKDKTKQVNLANQRFTSPTHPDGFGSAKATKINEAVHKHLCPRS